MKTALIALVLLAASPAWADNCAKYTDDLAYNACLAARGPKARGIPVGPAPAAAREGHVRAAPAARRPMRRRRVFARSRRGRSSMVFSVGK